MFVVAFLILMCILVHTHTHTSEIQMVVSFLGEIVFASFPHVRQHQSSSFVCRCLKTDFLVCRGLSSLGVFVNLQVGVNHDLKVWRDTYNAGRLVFHPEEWLMGDPGLSCVWLLLISLLLTCPCTHAHAHPHSTHTSVLRRTSRDRQVPQEKTVFSVSSYPSPPRCQVQLSQR